MYQEFQNLIEIRRKAFFIHKLFKKLYNKFLSDCLYFFINNSHKKAFVKRRSFDIDL